MAGLLEAGIEAYLPMMTRFKGPPSGDEADREKVQRPALEGYVFIQGTHAEVCLAVEIEAIHAVVSYRSNAGRMIPMPIPAGEITKLQDRELAGEFDETANARRYRPGKGERVRVTKGLFTGYIAEVIAMSPDERRVVLAMPQGRAEMKVDNVEAAA